MARKALPVAILASAVAFHVLMAGSLFWGYLDSFFDNSDLNPKGIDFFGIYQAGANVLDGRSVYAYHLPAGADVTPYFAPYRYVPIFAYVFAVPMNALPPWTAYWTWIAFYELLLAVNAFVTWRLAGGKVWGAIAASMWLVFTPVYLELYMGQFSLLMATALFWIGIGLVRKRESVALLPWFVTLIAKANSALLLPVLVRLRWWRSLLVAGFAFALNVPYFIWRFDDFRYFLWLNVQSVSESSGVALLRFRAADRPDLFSPMTDGRFFRFSSDDLGLVALIRNGYLAADRGGTYVPGAPVIALAIAVIALSLAATFLPRRADPLALFSIWVSTYFLLYQSWEHHYVMYLPVLALLLAQRPQMRAVTLVAFAFIAMPTPYWLMNHLFGPVPGPNQLASPQEAWPTWGVVLHHAVKPGAVLVLWSYLVGAQLFAPLAERRSAPEADGESVSWWRRLRTTSRRGAAPVP